MVCRPWSVVPCLIAVALLSAGCGGGGGAGGGPGGGGGFGTLQGSVTEVDGQTAQLGGVALTLAETGAVATSAPDGSFSFGFVPTGSLSVRVDGGGAALRKNGADDGVPAGGTEPGDDNGNDGPESGDDDGGDDRDDGDDDSPDDREIDDGDDLDDDGMEVHRVGDGERIELRLRVRDGRIVSAELSRTSGGEREAEVRMTRTAANDDPDMTGEVEVEARDDRQRFDVEVEHATPGRALEVVVVDGAGNEESIGVRAVDAFGEAEWEIRTNDGGRLPFGVAAVAEVEGMRVEVRDATTGAVLLFTDAPDLPAPVDTPTAPRERGRSALKAIEAGLTGHVEVRSRPEDGRERLSVQAERLAVGRVVEVWLEDPFAPDTFSPIGTRAASGAGEAELELDTGDGAVLPFGATSVADLAGLAVEVRDVATGDLLLSGLVPEAVPE